MILRSTVPYYPAVLDIAEWTQRTAGECALVDTACRALAPRWEEVRSANAPAPVDLGLRGGNQDDNEIGERLVLDGLARAISHAAHEQGIEVELPPLQEVKDRATRYFVRRALALPGFRLRKSVVSTGPDVPEDLAAAFALYPAGLPRVAAAALDISARDLETYAVAGPDGTPWIRGPSRSGTCAEVARAIALAWPADGWGYLRRAVAVAVGGDRDQLLDQHATLLIGTAHLGPELRHAHFSALAGALPASDERVSDVHLAAGLTAELCSDQAVQNRARDHYASALTQSRNPIQRCDLTYELANWHARRRTEEHLEIAERLYRDGAGLLTEVTDQVERVRLSIVFANGEALIHYHRGNTIKALEFESTARTLTENLPAEERSLRAWAHPLLAMNTAKIYARRCGDFQAAIAEIDRALLHLNPGPLRTRALMDRALAHLESGDVEQAAKGFQACLIDASADPDLAQRCELYLLIAAAKAGWQDEQTIALAQKYAQRVFEA